jgi:hypothetical protein
MKSKIFQCTILVIFLLIFIGCKKGFEFDKIKSVTWKPDIAVPLVKDDITFERALIETGSTKNFYIDDAGDISMLYYFHDNAFRISPNDLFTLPSFPFSFDHQVTTEEQQVISVQDLNLPPVNFTFNLTENDPGVQIDKLIVKEGAVTVNMNSSFSNAGNLRINFLNATKNGVLFSYDVGPISNGTSSFIIDLANVSFDLSSLSNILTIQIVGFFKKSDHPVVNDRIHADLTLNVNKIGWFEGNLGQKTFTPVESFVIVTAFNNAYVLGDVYFVDPMASISMVNSIGILARITILKLKGSNSSSNVSLDVTNNLGAAAVFSVPSPLITATEPVTTTIDYSNANTGNSMGSLFNIKPDNVHYKIKTEINPGKSATNFFSDTSSIYANLLVKLPLYGHFDHLTVQDTFDFSLNKQKDIESVNFRANVVNGLPMQARMQVYFTDNSFHKIDSLTGSNCIIIKEAQIDPSTHLPIPGVFGEKDTTFFFDRPRMEKLSNAEHVLVRAVMNSNDEGITNVKIRSTQALKLNLSAEIKMIRSLEINKK